MIPIFPEFKNLEVADRTEINQLTSKFSHYSDYQFPSLWAWDLDGTVMISRDDRNIYFKFRDYLSGKHFYSFVGDEEIVESSRKLLRFAKTDGLSELRLIPEEIAQQLAKNTEFSVEEDRDNFDYVIDVAKTLNNDNQDKSKKRAIRDFMRLYPLHNFQRLDVARQETKRIIVSCAHKWTVKRDGNPDRLDNEIPAMERLISRQANIDLVVHGLFNERKLIGFSIEELIGDNFAMGHFQRADYEYRGAFQFLDHLVNEYMLKRGVAEINIQQDVGDHKLRETKLKNSHFKFLRKYKVRLVT